MAGRPSIRTKALVLLQTKLSEQDLILTMLDEHGTRRRAVAKGARKPSGRLASRVELFCESDVLIAKGRSLDIVTEAALVEAHAGLRGDPERMYAASAVLEVARLTCYEDVEDPYLFAICSRALQACEQAVDQPHLDLVVAAYTFKVMAHGGWRPELSSCLSCGDPAVSHFSAPMGGLLCASCARDLVDAVELDVRQVGWLRALIELTFDQLLDAPVSVDDGVLMLSLAHSWGVVHLDTRLRTFEFLMSM